MSNVKDKLSASMHTVKAKKKPVTAKQARPTPDKTAAKPAVEKPTAPRKPARKAPATGKTTVPGDVPESGTALFPSRVWPD